MSLVAMSGNQDIDGVLWGVKWDLAALTYGFATQTSQYFGYQVSTITGFEAFNAAQKAAATDAVNQLVGLINLGITLTNDPSQANLRFAEATSVNQRFDPITLLPTPGVITTAVGTPPDDFQFPTFAHGDIFFNRNDYNAPTKGNFAYATVIHELGHAVGLKHGHITQNFPNGSFVIPALPAAHDSMEFSIMTYRSNAGGPSDHYRNEDFGYAQTWMMDDIAALQYLYGADFTTNAGNTVYSWNRTTGEMFVNGVGQGTPGANRVFLTIWDGNGIDTYDMANYTAKVTIDLNPGGFSITSQDQLAILNTDDGIKARGNVFNALLFNGDVRSLIENALGGSGDDTITGNVAANDLRGNAGDDTLSGLDGADKLSGGDGDDTLNGGTGADMMVGGLGNDSYIVDNVADTVSETSAAATEIDTVRSSVSFALSANVEKLVLTGTAAIAGTGNALANTITGNAAANTLDGGAGNDILEGGLGNDTYVLADGSDTVIDSGGIDLITSTITRTLAGFAAIENLSLLGSAAINATGNALANTLVGNAGNNQLNGLGGNDTMFGGAGNDIYYVDASGDTVLEATGGGSDTVRTSVSFALAAGSEIERFTTTNSALTTAINLTGNGFAQTIEGNAGANTIDGGGGNDRLVGLGGNDRYIVDSVSDVVDESVTGSGGVDTVLSSVRFDLGDASRAKGAIENVTLTGVASNATGNALANILTGNAGANALNGAGGADTMRGLGGDDRYTVDNAGDVVDESLAGSAGTDTVQSSVRFSLSDTVHAMGSIENLTLTGSGAINGTGNALDNLLTGNSGNNILNGKAGADTMTGGAGDDTYYVDNAGDKAIEASGGGTDQVFSTVSYSLSGQHIEKLTLTGSAAINATGNTLANTLTGNAGNNVLNGGGGADTMTGGAGDDTYYVDNAGDKTVEVSGGGTDQVFSTVSYSVSTQFIEKLTLTGSAAIDATGNSMANTLTGNSANNVLNGNAGADVMTGGGGSDTFVFSISLVAGVIDTITDFSVAADTIRLSHTIFNTIVGLGTLSAAQFAANTGGTALDADDRIIYETDTGKLFFDSNGSAASGAIQFAQLSSGLALSANNFSIV